MATEVQLEALRVLFEKHANIHGWLTEENRAHVFEIISRATEPRVQKLKKKEKIPKPEPPQDEAPQSPTKDETQARPRRLIPNVSERTEKDERFEDMLDITKENIDPQEPSVPIRKMKKIIIGEEDENEPVADQARVNRVTEAPAFVSDVPLAAHLGSPAADGVGSNLEGVEDEGEENEEEEDDNAPRNPFLDDEAEETDCSHCSEEMEPHHGVTKKKHIIEGDEEDACNEEDEPELAEQAAREDDPHVKVGPAAPLVEGEDDDDEEDDDYREGECDDNGEHGEDTEFHTAVDETAAAATILSSEPHRPLAPVTQILTADQSIICAANASVGKAQQVAEPFASASLNSSAFFVVESAAAEPSADQTLVPPVEQSAHERSVSIADQSVLAADQSQMARSVLSPSQSISVSVAEETEQELIAKQLLQAGMFFSPKSSPARLSVTGANRPAAVAVDESFATSNSPIGPVIVAKPSALVSQAAAADSPLIIARKASGRKAVVISDDEEDAPPNVTAPAVVRPKTATSVAPPHKKPPVIEDSVIEDESEENKTPPKQTPKRRARKSDLWIVKDGEEEALDEGEEEEEEEEEEEKDASSEDEEEDDMHEITPPRVAPSASKSRVGIAPPVTPSRPMTTPSRVPGTPLSVVIATPAKTGSFSVIQQRVAQQLYAEFNTKVFEGKLPLDLPLVWTTKLKTTAGRTLLLRVGDFWKVSRIELEQKIVDCETRLKSTLMHEMCHAAAWCIDHIAAPPHGITFKKWAARAMKCYPGLRVSTTHNYSINYKYKWTCVECQAEFGRHSKSIKTETHKCFCGGCLQLTQAPRMPKDLPAITPSKSKK